MGRQKGGLERLFYSFNLDDHIPQNHLLRGIDRHLDLSELRAHLVDAYSATKNRPKSMIPAPPAPGLFRSRADPQPGAKRNKKTDLLIMKLRAKVGVKTLVRANCMICIEVFLGC